MKYGYARVSTEDQKSALQLAALKKSGDLFHVNNRAALAAYLDVAAVKTKKN